MSEFTILAYDLAQGIAYLGDGTGEVGAVPFEDLAAYVPLSLPTLVPKSLPDLRYYLPVRPNMDDGYHWANLRQTDTVTPRKFLTASKAVIKCGFAFGLGKWFLWADKLPERESL